MTDKIWRIFPPSTHTPRLAHETGISPLKAQLLINRGITAKDTAASFLTPRLSDLTNPMLLLDMDRAVDLIMNAIKKQELIAVYGDYDADGITSTALISNFFAELGVPISYYIPNRINEGYGLNSSAINELSKRGMRLIITVDCGISNTKEIEQAKSFFTVSYSNSLPQIRQPDRNRFDIDVSLPKPRIIIHYLPLFV